MTAAVAAGERLDELARSHTQSPWRLGPADGEHLDPARLWKMMLAIQRRFRCYNSARMSAALEDAAVEAVVRKSCFLACSSQYICTYVTLADLDNSVASLS